MLLYALLLLAAISCAFLALRAEKLLVSALWLAATSAFTALLLYLMGAQTIAVVELSVGAGLVTVLFVFAISVAGDESMDMRTVIPRPLAIGLVLVTGVALAWLTLMHPAASAALAVPTSTGQLASTLWQDRGLDMLLQIVLIFGGVLGVLGLLADAKTSSMTRPPAQPPQIQNPKSGEAHS
ncbi:MAG TPA: NADH-quinone oxidoreductase subunit J [Anaerolineae bacterium]